MNEDRTKDAEETQGNKRPWSSGPWSVPHFARPDVGCECGYVLWDGGFGAICTVHASGESNGSILDTGDNPQFAEACANARLIAASPELFEALADAVRMYGSEGGPWNVPSHPGSWIAQAKAALAKALGGQP